MLQALPAFHTTHKAVSSTAFLCHHNTLKQHSLQFAPDINFVSKKYHLFKKNVSLLQTNLL